MMVQLKRALADEKLGLYFMVFLANMGWGVMTPILGNIQEAFAVSVFQVSLANAAFGIARLVVDLPIGVLMDRVDQRAIRLSGAIVLSLGAILCAVAPTFDFILVGRLVTGLGAAIIQVTNLVWISALSTDERRGRDLGIYQAVFQAGTSISPIAGGLLASWTSWRGSFWFAAVMSLLAFAPMLSRNAGWLEKVRSVARGPRPAKGAKAGAISSDSRLAPIIVANLITFVLFYSVGGFQNTVVPLFGSSVLGLNAGVIGIALGLSTVVRFVMSLIGGELSDRYGRRAVLIPGLIVIGIGTLMLNRAVDLTTYAIAILVLSIGRFGNNVPATVLADHTPRDRWGFMMGLNRSIGDLGIVLGPITMGLLLENMGYGATTWFSAMVVWLSAITVVLWVNETQSRQPILAQVREWLSRSGG